MRILRMSARQVSLLAAFTGGALLTLAAVTVDWRHLMNVSVQAEEALYPLRDWSRGAPGRLNISVFTFGDRNRNGRYDLGDKPIAGIAVRLTRPDDSTRIARSNINGFANFEMQRDGDEDDVDITVVGREYRFEVLPPRDWQITTGNGRQRSAFMSVAGAISGLGAKEPPGVVGLAPPATISGHWPGHGDSVLTLRGDDGEEMRTTLDREGRFLVTAAPGPWTLTHAAAAPRELQLAYAPIVVGAPATDAGTASPVSSADGTSRTIDFDKLPRSAIEKLASGYAGLHWDYLLAVDNQFYKGPGYVNGLSSGDMVAYNSSGHPVTISALEDGQAFDFISGLFSVAWHNAEGETLQVRAFRNGELVAGDDLTLSHLTPVLLQADYRGIDRLTLTTEHYWQFVVDDLVVALPDGTGGSH